MSTCYQSNSTRGPESDRDVQNDQINARLELLLLHLQELNASCEAEQSKKNNGNFSFLDVCTVIKTRLQFLTRRISDYVSDQICHYAAIVANICFVQ